jgi:hypothetical protein
VRLGTRIADDGTAAAAAASFVLSCEGDMLGTILLVVLILLLIGAFPSWPYSRGWGYAPTGTLGVLVVIVIVLVLLGMI